MRPKRLIGPRFPLLSKIQARALTFEMRHGHHDFPKLDLFMWRREGGEEFEQYRCLTGFNSQPLCAGRPVTVFNIQDLNITHYAEFGTLLSHGSRLIVAGQAAILLDSRATEHGALQALHASCERRE